MSHLTQGNKAFSDNNHTEAIAHYVQAFLDIPAPVRENPYLAEMIVQNIQLARSRYRDFRFKSQSLCLVCCGWNIDSTFHEKVQKLEACYQSLEQLELINCFPANNENLPDSKVHNLAVEDRNSFFLKALTLVAANPADVVYLITPRIPNILIGIAYKLLWSSAVVVVDDDLCDTGAWIDIDQYPAKNFLPEFSDFSNEQWLGVTQRLVHFFDKLQGSSQSLEQPNPPDLPESAWISELPQTLVTFLVKVQALPLYCLLAGIPLTRISCIRGYIDRFENGNILGWAADCWDFKRNLQLSVFIDDTNIGSCRADIFRADLKNNGIGFGYHAFHIEVPEKWRDAQEHKIAIRVEGEEPILAGNPEKQIILESTPGWSHPDYAPDIVFVMPGRIESNNGYHVQLLTEMLSHQGLRSVIAVPDHSFSPASNLSTAIIPYSAVSMLADFPSIIHAWTPRETVRRFCENLLKDHKSHLLVHLEDNEQYLTQATVRQDWNELQTLTKNELDRIIPEDRYHPVHGRAFLDKAQGLTMVIETLNRYNIQNVPYLLVPPFIDNQLFYLRPLNMSLRAEHDIDQDTIVLVYTGNVHDANREEVFELYQAVERLNQQGQPTVLFRTGNKHPSSWPDKNVIHLGWVPRNKMPEIMAAADIFVQPGESDGFNDERIPSKLPEYFAIGRPVIMPRTNLGLQMEHGREAWILDRGNAQSIVEAVKKIYDDKQLAKELAINAICFYRRMVYPLFMENSLCSLYEQLVDQKIA